MCCAFDTTSSRELRSVHDQFRTLASPLRCCSCVPTPTCVHDVDNEPRKERPQTVSCARVTWRWVVLVGEDQAAHGHWCTFTDLCHAMPHQLLSLPLSLPPAPTCYPAQWDGSRSGYAVAAFPLPRCSFLGRWGTHACLPAVSA